MIDLHTHSTASDGTFTPSELIADAKERGVEAIALTDHDTLDGLAEAIEKGKEIGLEVINGIEFSTEYSGKEVHILGYLFDIDNKILNAKVEELRLDRERRTKLMLEKLAKYKLPISMEEILEEVEGNIISRTHIANAMLKKGYVYTKSEAFRSYLSPTGVAYVPKENIDPFEAIRVIKESGGIASLAHPKLIGLGREKYEEFLAQLAKAGLDAVEVYYPGFEKGDEEYYKKTADKYNLLYTGGSDFHGLNRPGTYPGKKGISREEFESLKKRLQG